MSGLILILSFGILVYQHLDKVKVFAIKELNKHLNVEVKVDRIDIHVFSNFPEVNFSFYGLNVSSPIPGDSALISHAKASVGFNALQLLQGDYVIQSIEIWDASLHLMKNQFDKANWDIVKEVSKSEKEKPGKFKLSLKKIQFVNSEVGFIDVTSKLALRFRILDSKLKGDFSERNYLVSVNTEMQVKDLILDQLNLFQNKNIQLSSSLNVSSDKFTLGKSDLIIDKLPLTLQGYFNLGKQSGYKIEFKSPGTTIAQLLSIMPFELPAAFDEYKASGATFFNGSLISGNTTVSSGSKLDLEFGINNGSLTNSANGIALKQINLLGSWKGKFGTTIESEIKLNRFSGQLERSRFEGEANILLGKDKRIATKLKANLDLNEVLKWYPIQMLKSIQGQADLELMLAFKPNLVSESWEPLIAESEIGLNINASQIEFNNSKKSIQEISAQGNLSGRKLQVSDLRILLGQSDIQASAVIDGIFDQELLPIAINVKANSKNLNGSDLLGWPSFNSSIKTDSLEQVPTRTFLMNLELFAQSFHQEKFHSSDFRIKANLDKNEIQIKNLNFKAWSGNISATGNFEIGDGRYVLISDEEIKGVRAKQLLQEFDDFGQTAIKSNHIDGTLNGKFRTRLVWDSNFNLSTKEFYALGELEWKEGRLFNYTPLYALSGFLDLNDLKDLRFQEMKNVIEVKNEVLSIPEMAIRTNAIGLLLSGTHTFNNFLDYRMKVSLSEVLNRKRKVKPNEFGETEEGSNKATLMLRIKGPADKLTFSYDKQAISEKVRETVKEEKKAILSTLKNELSIFRDSSIKENNSNNNNHEELEFNPD